MKSIKILGSGCAKCNKLYELSEKAAGELNLDYEMEKITDLGKFAEFGVMITPALVVDGKLKIAGSVPAMDKLKQLINE